MSIKRPIWLVGLAITALTGPVSAQEGDEDSPVFGPDSTGKAPKDDVGQGDVNTGSGATDVGHRDVPPVVEPARAESEASLSIGRRQGASNDSAIATPGQLAPEQRADFELSVFGYVRMLIDVVQDDPDVSFVGRNDGFRLQNARVGIDARFRDKIYVRISADGANDEREGTNDVEGTLRFGLKDAFADVKLTSAMELRAGRFPVLFDLENFTSAVQRGFIRRSLESRGVSPTDGFESPGLGVSRNLGVAMRSPRAYQGSSFALGYELAAQNGNGELDAQNDNDKLAYSGTAIAYFGDKVFSFASLRYNERTEGDLPVRRNERDLSAAVGAWIDVAPVRFAGQFIFQRTTFPTTSADDERASGGHAEILVTVPGTGGLVGGYRFALLDESDRMAANRVIEHTVGVGYGLPSYGVRLKLDFTLPIEEPGRELDNSRAEALVEVQL